MANGDNQKSTNQRTSASTTGSQNVWESNDPFEVIGFLLALLLVGGFIIERIISFSTGEAPFLVAAHSYALRAMAFIVPISILISGFLIFGIFYSVNRLKKIRKELSLRFLSHKETVSNSHIFESKAKKRWEKIMDYLNSTNSNDWKVAILEADVMLEEMVDRMGYVGDSLGEKFKNIERSDFTTIEKAWEAHKIRNTIAHEGSRFTITLGETKRVLGLFEEVLKEFRYI